MGLKDILKSRLVRLLVSEKALPAAFVFIPLLYSESQLTLTDSLVYSTWVAQLIVLLSTNFNFLYIPVLYHRFNIFTVAAMLLGLCACTKKWKLMVCMFTLGRWCASDYVHAQTLLTIIYATIICMNTYKHLPFQNIADNKVYFTGFYATVWYSVISYILIVTEGHKYLAFMTLPLSIYFGAKIISNRIGSMSNQPFDQIEDSSLLCRRIQIITQQLNQGNRKPYQIFLHNEYCKDLDCFCRKFIDTDPQFRQQFIKCHYLKALQQCFLSDRFELLANYIEYLLSVDGVIEASVMLSRYSVNPNSLFDRFTSLRLQGLIEQNAQKVSSNDPYDKEYVYALQYDHQYHRLIQKIKHILTKKITFWLQVGKESPRMKILQTEGLNITHLMTALNKFYYDSIKPKEDVMQQYNGTIVYAMYLLSTTNFKDFAQTLIEGASRALQFVQMQENSISECYAIRLVLKSVDDIYDNRSLVEIKKIHQKRSHRSIGLLKHSDGLGQDGTANEVATMGHQKDRFNPNKSINKAANIFIIDNITLALSSVLGQSRKYYIGKQLDCLIPNLYKELHYEQVEAALSNSTPHLLRQVKLVPLKIGDGVMESKMCIKPGISQSQGLFFTIVLQTVKKPQELILLSLSSQPHQSHANFPRQILQSNEFRDYFQQYKLANQLEQLSSKMIVLPNGNFTIKLSVPFWKHFKERPHLQPCIHMQVLNESSSNQKKSENRDQLQNCIKKIESVFYKNSKESQNSTTSKKSSVISVLTTYSNSNSVSALRKLGFAVFFQLLLGIVVLNIGEFFLDTGWDNTTVESNPLYILASLGQLQAYYLKAIDYAEIEHVVKKYEASLEQIEAIFGTQDFKSFEMETFLLFVPPLRKILLNKILTTPSFLRGVITNSLTKKIQIQSVHINDDGSKTKVSQLIAVSNIIENYLNDIMLLRKGFEVSQLILGTSFQDKVEPVLLELFDNLSTAISDFLVNQTLYNFLFIGGAFLASFLTVALIWRQLKAMRAKHQQIYDMVSSVDGSLIALELRQLNNIVNIVQNSTESSDLLRINTINYMARKLTSARASGLSQPNEMIIGINRNAQAIYSREVESPRIDVVDQLGQFIRGNMGATPTDKENRENVNTPTVNHNQSIQDQSSTKLNSNSNMRLNNMVNLNHSINESLASQRSNYDQLLVHNRSHERNNSNDTSPPINPQPSSTTNNRPQLNIGRIRHRVGELNTDDTQSDSSKCIPLNWVFYLICLWSLFLLLANIVIKISHFGSIVLTNEQIYFQVSRSLHSSLKLRKIQQYLMTEDTQEQSKIQAKIQLMMLNLTTTTSYYVLQPPSRQRLYNSEVCYLIEKTYQNNHYNERNNPMNKNTTCNMLTQTNLLEQLQLLQLEIYQTAKSINMNKQATKQQIARMNSHSPTGVNYLLASGVDSAITIVTFVSCQQLLAQSAQSTKQSNYKSMLLYQIAFVSVFIIIMPAILIIIRKMKQKYIQEITVVSFLNTEMITQNKRVESFLEALYKIS